MNQSVNGMSRILNLCSFDIRDIRLNWEILQEASRCLTMIGKHWLDQTD